MENNIAKNVNPITIVVALFQVILIIVVVVTLNNIFSNDSKVQLGIEVAGLQQEIEGLPEKRKEDIEYYIYKAVASVKGESEIQNTGVLIRENSLINTYYKDFDIHYINFIADVPEAEQSYQVLLEWSEDPENKYISPSYSAVVLCLDKSQLIYGDFDCDHQNDYFRNTEVMNMLYRHGYALPSKPSLKMRTESYPSSPDFKVKINYVYCESQCDCLAVSTDKQAEGVKVFEDFVKSLGFRPEDIPHYFDNCS